MRSLMQRGVLARAGVAATLTEVACYPRIATWPRPVETGPVVFLALLWCAFVMWGFVFAWHEQYSGRAVFNFEVRPKLWLMATATGVVVALLLHYAMDPQLRTATPENYPGDGRSWGIGALFRVGFEPLCLIFAPYAFFIRLSRKQTTALALTVVFVLFVQYERLTITKPLPGLPMVAGLLLLRAVGACLSVYFYLKGGVLVVWWVAFLEQLRLLIDVVGRHE